MCEMSHMTEFDIEAFKARLQSLMDEHNIKRKPLAKKAGLGETAIRDIFEAKRSDVRVGTLVRLAEVFDITIDDLISEPQLKLSGRIGAGGEVLFNGDDHESDDFAPRPPGAHGKIMALQVVGNSMLPKYEDGDIVYVDRTVDGISPDAIGEYCAVRTLEGGTFLKIFARGTMPGRYTLRSLNAPDMEDQEVAWAAPVRWVRQKPRRTS
jgi:transcriptional regulator with XRE-family HTH domain